MSLREKIALILDLAKTDSWQIVDTRTEAGLYMIHYTPDASMSRYGFIRGLVVDVPNQVVVAHSEGYKPTTTSSSLEVNNGLIQLRNAANINIEYHLDPETTKFYPGFDGPEIRLFFHAGQVYYSSTKNLDISQLRWGDSKTFLEIYQELGGPRGEDLFDLNKNYSPHVHTFILVDPSLQVASKSPIGVGYLVYLGSWQMWEPENSPYPIDEIDQELRVPETTSEFQPYPTTPLLYAPPELTLEEANNFLSFGFYQPFEQGFLPERLLPGEFVLAYPETSTEVPALRIESPSYYWRSSLHDETPNLEYQFFLLANNKLIQAQYDDEQELYLRKYPLLTPYPQEELEGLLSDNGLVVWPQQELSPEMMNQILSSPQERLYNIFLAYLASLPSYFQPQGLGLHTNYLSRLDEIKEELINLHYKNDFSAGMVPNRAKQMIAFARGVARARLEEGTLDNFDSLVEEELRRMVEVEEGASLYYLGQALISMTTSKPVKATEEEEK